MLDRLFEKVSKLKLRDALRMGIQSSFSAAITYLIMRYFDLPEMFVGILSAVLIVDTSVGHTMGLGKQRVLSTLIGSIVGFLCVWLLPYGVGTVVSLIISMLIINGIAGFWPEWRYGVVAAVALSLGSENNALESSIDRLISIAIGVGVGIVASLVIWPDKAESRAVRFVRHALNAACDKFEVAYSNTHRKDNKSSNETSDSFHSNLNAAKKSVSAIKFTESKEIKNLVEIVERLYNSILIINRVADKAHEDVSGDGSGIQQDAEEIKEKACNIMRAMAKEKKVAKQQLEDFISEIKNIQSEVNISDDHTVNTRRQTFVFGLNEICESITSLSDTFKKI